MTIIDKEIIFKAKKLGGFPGPYAAGVVNGLKTAKELIGTCNGCTHSFIAGSELRCKFRVHSCSVDGYCEEHKRRYVKEQEECIMD